MTRPTPPDPYAFLPAVPALAVDSADVRPGARLAEAQLAAGGNTSPAIGWEPGPEGTASYAVTCIDPDAPTPGGVWHWVVADIPAHVTALPAGGGDGLGRTLRNDLGSLDYVGAAPPPGDREHRYVFAVHALGVAELPVDEQTPAALTGFHLTVNTLARGTVTGLARTEA
ncbi:MULTISPECIES: YbhB/YbcL family Raf kinase inhibitor-like protein [unclassified Streptomyces]|uniref:YbhB/YbcL family Raf kinase inhibitor-like protein n=1 Tax=unclassified Streptomyces TaxID=2593676 RepID=UPI0036F85857